MTGRAPVADAGEMLARALGHHQAGRRKDAESGYRKVLEIEPGDPDALHLLGVLAHEAGNNARAVDLIGRAIAVKDDFADYHSNLGHALWELGRVDEAEAACRRALALRETYPEAHNNLGNALWSQGRLGEAEASYRRALGLRPEYAETASNLGNVLRAQGRLGEAEAAYRRALALRPDFADAWSNLGMALRVQGRLAESGSCYGHALALAPGDASIHSNLIFALDFDPRATAACAFAERRRWNTRHARSRAGRIAPHRNRPDPERRLRVGYVSADFRRHSAAAVLAPVILGHDRERFDVACYSGVVRPDELTARLAARVTTWRPTAELSDAALARLIRDDRIDVLVDLSGHSAGNRLGAFALKPAPVQVTAWGHAVGTGLDAMDYFFADPVVAPLAARRHFSETVVDLPGLVCFEPPGDAPEVGPLPALTAGHLTFGCLNRRSKISDDAVHVWSAILAAAGDARLVLKDESFNAAPAREEIRRRFRAWERVEVRGGTEQREHLAAYGEVDVALDPFPHGGGVTGLEGLWMGVPMVTLGGERVPGRMGVSFMMALGLGEFVARTREEYVRVAVRWARDVERLGPVRAGLRGWMRGSALCDGARYCRAVEAAYREMWRRWCAGRGRR